MEMNNEIEIQLQKLGMPYSFEEHSTDDATYVVYSEYDGRPTSFADNKELDESYYYQFDIFSTGNYTQIERDLKTLLKEIGGVRINQFSNKEDGYYQKSIRFRFDKEIY